MEQETIKVTGHINFKLIDETGTIKEEKDINNLVVTAGKNYLAAWLAAASQAGYFMQYIALGSDDTAPQATDTQLVSEHPTRVAGTVTSSTNVWQNVASFGPGVNTGQIKEAGLFSIAAVGTMLARQAFSVINKAAGDTLQVTWQITLS